MKFTCLSKIEAVKTNQKGKSPRSLNFITAS
jgi:hypothetical protein